MTDQHAPRPEFVDRLEANIGAEIRRRNREAHAPRTTGPSRWQLAFAALGLVIVSMAAGGAVVAAAYQSQANQERQALAATWERRLQLDRERLEIARTELRDAERRMQVGIGTRETLLEAEAKVTEGEALLRSLELQLEEVRMTGRDPRTEVSAPLVNGRDFVLQRWQVEIIIPESALKLEKMRLQALQIKSEIGLVDTTEVDIARARVLELAIALEAAQRRISLRQRFAEGKVSAEIAELRLAEVAAEQRRRVVEPQLDLAKRHLALSKARSERGAVGLVEVSKAQLRVTELEYELMKADYELALVRRQLMGKD